jgi:hypothetical protein
MYMQLMGHWLVPLNSAALSTGITMFASLGRMYMQLDSDWKFGKYYGFYISMFASLGGMGYGVLSPSSDRRDGLVCSRQRMSDPTSCHHLKQYPVPSWKCSHLILGVLGCTHA